MCQQWPRQSQRAPYHMTTGEHGILMQTSCLMLLLPHLRKDPSAGIPAASWHHQLPLLYHRTCCLLPC